MLHEIYSINLKDVPFKTPPTCLLKFMYFTTPQKNTRKTFNDLLTQPLDSKKTIFTIPSIKHIDKNHDAGYVYTASEEYTFSIICDGVSNCGKDSTGTAVTGAQAAKEVSDTLYTQLRHPYSQSIISECAQHVVDGYKNLQTESVITFYDFQLLKMNYHSPLLEIQKILFDHTSNITITPPQSATTLQIAFQIKINNEIYLFAYSCGDSATVVVDGSTFETKQLNALMYDYTDSQCVFAYNDLQINPIKIRNASYPAGYIKHKKATPGNLTWIKLNPNDIVVSFSDGIGDAFTENIPLDNPHSLSTKLDITSFSNALKYTASNGFSDAETARFLTLIATVISPKSDDITVVVTTIKNRTSILKEQPVES